VAQGIDTEFKTPVLPKKKKVNERYEGIIQLGDLYPTGEVTSY
jgi:hypothetical protein